MESRKQKPLLLPFKTIDFKSLSFVTTYICFFLNCWKAVRNSVSVQALFTKNLLFCLHKQLEQKKVKLGLLLACRIKA